MVIKVRTIVQQHEHLEEGDLQYTVADWRDVFEIVTLLEASTASKVKVMSIEVVE